MTKVVIVHILPFSCLKKCFPSQQKTLFNVNYSHTRVYFSFVRQAVKKLNQTQQVQSNRSFSPKRF